MSVVLLVGLEGLRDLRDPYIQDTFSTNPSTIPGSCLHGL